MELSRCNHELRHYADSLNGYKQLQVMQNGFLYVIYHLDDCKPSKIAKIQNQELVPMIKSIGISFNYHELKLIANFIREEL